ncbi:hypothetical protein V492_01444 [Pseudogymnoascus sp. VKM F-4246]|nr:hypothetical protein V492_01444 [Pseudogymnoascus sp. VKM F-4246]
MKASGQLQSGTTTASRIRSRDIHRLRPQAQSRARTSSSPAPTPSPPPFSSTSCSAGLKIENPQKTIDPDLFWDDDGTVYMASGWGGAIDLDTGAASPVTRIWNGTGGSNPVNEWPTAAPVKGGVMSGWHLAPAAGMEGPGGEKGEIRVDGADVVDFLCGEEIPGDWVRYCVPVESSYVVSPAGYEGRLRLTPEAANLTGTAEARGEAVTFVGRRQGVTLFEYSVDLEFTATIEGEEAGVTVFISREQHVDLGIIGEGGGRQLRFSATTFGKPNATAPEERVVDIPPSWGGKVRLQVEARDDKSYTFSAASTHGKHEVLEMGRAGADIVTSGTGRFVGTLVGAYATTNDGMGSTKAYLGRWRYTPLKQKVGEGVYVDVKGSGR